MQNKLQQEGEDRQAAFRMAMCTLGNVKDTGFFAPDAKAGEGYESLSAIINSHQFKGLAEALTTTGLPQPQEMAEFIIKNKLVSEGWLVKQVTAQSATEAAYSALILTKDGNTEIFFPGTPHNNFRKWEENFDIKAVPFTCGDKKTVCMVHKGFAEIHEQIKGKVDAELAALKAAGKLSHAGEPGSIGISGYSEGGAVSQLFILGLEDDLRNRASLCTFAAPRVGKTNGGFIEAVKKLLPYKPVHFRVDHDPVTRVPLMCLHFANTPGEYFGLGTHKFLSGRFFAAAARKIPVIKNHLFMSAGGQGIIGSPKFHYPLGYLQKIMKGPWRVLDISTERAVKPGPGFRP